LKKHLLFKINNNITIIKMSKKFLLRVVDEVNKDLYENHNTYHKGDAGLDLFVVEDTTILPGETVLVDMGIQCQSRSFDSCVWHWLRGNFYKYHSYLLMPRSSISKTPLLMRNSVGLIDAGYLGNIKAPLYNTSSEPFYLKRGQRYVQLVNGDLSPVSMEIVSEHRSTTRGSGGFGSTGA
jgi:dUTP pyrophosphatase